MTSGRVALVGLPDLLGEIVRVHVVLRSDDDEVRLLRAVERLGANVLVVNDQSLDGEAIADLLREHPDVQALDISADGSQAYAYRPGRVLLGGLSPEALGEAVRHIPGREAE
jgi:hypothetical protein